MLFLTRSSRMAYLAAVAGAGLVLGVDSLFSGPLQVFLGTVAFIAAVLAAGSLGGWKPGVLATILCLVGYNFFFIEPIYSLRIVNTPDLLSMLGYLVVGASLSGLCEALHDSGARLTERQNRLEREIVAHQQSELALKEAERRARDESQRNITNANLLRVTLSSIGDGVIATDADGRVTFMNSVAEELTGWPQQDARERPLSEVFRLINERTRAPEADPVVHVVKSGTVVGMANHILLISRHGTETPIADSAAPINDDSGRLIGVVLVFRDATNERMTTDALQRLAAIVQSSEDAIIGKSIDGLITSWNDAAMRLYGYTAEEAVGKGIEIIVPTDRRDELVGFMHRLKAGQRIEHHDTIRRRKDGTLVHVSLQISPIRNAEGEIVGASKVARDITERKRTEEALHFLNRTSGSLSSLTDRASAFQKASRLMVPFFADYCVIHTIGDNGEIHCQACAHRDAEKDVVLHQMLENYRLDWNSEAISVQAMRLATTQLWSEVPDAYLDRMAQDPGLEQLRILKPKSVICVPLSIRGKIIGVLGFVSSDSGRRYVPDDVVIAEDLAQRVATAIDNSELLDSVKEADRQKDEFLAMLAHELRNPLVAINYANSLMQISTAEMRPELVEIVDRQVGNLAHLIDDLLDVSRISRNKIQLRKEHIDAGTLVRRATAAARPQMEEKHHELTLDVDAKPMPLCVDATRVEQIISNLLTNAAKYTPDGGQVVVNAAAQNGEAVIKVKDTGIGIPSDMLTRVFDLFAQSDRSLDRSQGGLGIGLTVARKLAEMHGGTVTAASEGTGRGAEFTIRLPLTDIAPVPLSDVRIPAELSSKSRLRVLVVDDNRDTAQTEALLVSELGHEVQIAHDGLAAIEAAQSFHPDVIFLDIGLPQLNGYEVAKRLRSEGIHQGTLIAVSGYGRAEDEERSREAGFDRHLTKPVDHKTLRSVLSRVGASSP